MHFLVEKLFLTGPDGRSMMWSETPVPHRLCEASGDDAGAVLATVVAGEGCLQVGLSAVFTNGQAVTIARDGDTLFALRAVPAF